MDFRQFQERLLAMRPRDFERFMIDVARDSGLFSEVRGNAYIDGTEIDIVATDVLRGAEKPGKTFFEVKSGKIIPREVIYQVEGIRKFLNERFPGGTRLILAVSAPLSASALQAAANQSVEIWDSLHIAGVAKPETIVAHFGEALDAKPASAPAKKEHVLSAQLRSIEPGRGDAMDFQRLIVQIFELLFCPPLERPRFELNDKDRRNRRDMIFENAAPGGFWATTRQTYEAHYLVVDAKNYTDPIDKGSVLDIAHYLKPHGVGMFGILVSRVGASEAAQHAIREQWIGSSKMIVSLRDDDLHEMLRIHGEGGRPEEIIRDRIAEFRMGL